MSTLIQKSNLELVPELTLVAVTLEELKEEGGEEERRREEGCICHDRWSKTEREEWRD